MAAIFISRDLEPTSPFRRQLEAAGHTVTARSLVRFRALPFHVDQPVDWVFFSSPRAVHFFLEGSVPAPGISLAALGPGTARELADHGRRADFVGNGDPQATASAFLAVAAGERVLFPRARSSRRSVQQWLGTQIVSREVVVYDNRPSTDVPQNTFRVLVFTSPLNAQAFFAVRTLQPDQLVVAIGNTTARALQQLGLENVAVAEAPAETALAAAVLKLLKKK